MNILDARYGVNFGLFISSVLFGAFHLFNPDVNYIAILNIILVGYLFGLYVINTNDLLGILSYSQYLEFFSRKFI
ncbi:CPBP family intramembrane metalloprotease [[Eubacterium] tenue]|nr:CPBP family glutamic-type intramembrane protease [[Eubacterium] tenue]MBC8632766.1 CPBP family intramembrane metalloprotease [[Eubacterium] tenue]